MSYEGDADYKDEAEMYAFTDTFWWRSDSRGFGDQGMKVLAFVGVVYVYLIDTIIKAALYPFRKIGGQK